MNILIGSLTYSLPNGVTTSIDASVDGLIADGHKVFIISPKYKETKYRPEHYQIPSSSVASAFGSLVKTKQKTFGITANFHIDKIVKKFNPDIYWLHTLSYPPNFFESYMFKSEKPKVLSYHTLVEGYGEMYGGKIGADIMRYRSKSVANKMDAVIVPNKNIKRKLRQYGIKKPIHVIPTGISIIKDYFTKEELRAKIKIPLNSKILLYVGRVCKEKNIKELLRIMKEIKKKDSSVFLLIVGAGEIDRFKHIAKRMEIEDRVIFFGSFSAKEAQKIYGGSDIFVFPSKIETQALVIGEAMMAKVPVVAFQSENQSKSYPKNLFTLVENESEFLAEVLDILKNPEKKNKKIKMAKKFILENFSEKEMIQKQKELLLKICGGPTS